MFPRALLIPIAVVVLVYIVFIQLFTKLAYFCISLILLCNESQYLVLAEGKKMDIDECRTRLQDKVRLLHPKNVEGIVEYMIANTPLENIRSYLLTATDNVLMNLFEGANHLQNILNLSEENEPLFGLFTPFDQIGPQKQHQFSSRNHSQVI